MIRTRLTVWNCTILTLVLAAIGAAIYWTARKAAFDTLDGNLNQRARWFMASRPPGGFIFGEGFQGSRPVGPDGKPLMDVEVPPGSTHPPRPRPTRPPIDVNALRERGIDPAAVQRIFLLSDALMPHVIGLDGKGYGRVLRPPWSMKGFEDARRLGRMNFTNSEVEGVAFRVMSLPLRYKNRVLAVVQFAEPLNATREMLESLARTLALVLPLAVIAMLVAGVVLTRQALRPIGQVAAAAERIGGSTLGDRLPVEGKDEFAHLSQTFNGMLGRLEAAFAEREEANQALRRFTADASHELKTPLTAIKARTGVALRARNDAKALLEHIEAIDRAATVMGSVVQDLLMLTASDEGRLMLNREQVEVQTLIEDAIASVDGSEHKIAKTLEGNFSLNVDPSAITRVLVNLLQNSIRHTAPGGGISVCATHPDGVALLVVRDEGVGIGPEHINRVFDRFYRVDTARDRESGGSGLGLAIAKTIVEAHGGRIWLESKPSRGTTVSIELPTES